MGECLHPHRHEYPEDCNLYWLRQLRMFYWNWRGKLLVAVEKDSSGKEVRIDGYAHWERKGNDDVAKRMTLSWFDPRHFRRIRTRSRPCETSLSVFTTGIHKRHTSAFSPLVVVS